MNIYILRAKPHNRNRENEFLNGKISIGWPCSQNLDGKKRNELETILKEKYSAISTINISQVEQFINIPQDSIVITPSIKNKSLIHLFKTRSTYKYNPINDNNEIGNPHFIDVELIKTIERLELPENIRRSLSGARKTVSNISKHSKIMEAFLNNENPISSELTNQRKEEVLNVLEELLKSDNEEIRLKASIELLNQLK